VGIWWTKGERERTEESKQYRGGWIAAVFEEIW
jgi:hypothetical protein